MARPKKAAQHVEPEDESQDIEALEATEPDEEEDEDDSDEPRMSKVAAIRAALAAGKESPDEGTAFVRDRFGIEISKQHFSSTKSQLKKKEGGGGAPKGKRAPRAAKASAQAPQEPQRSARAETPTASGPDMIGDLEAVKALVKRLGAEQVKRIADLFED